MRNLIIGSLLCACAFAQGRINAVGPDMMKHQPPMRKSGTSRRREQKVLPPIPRRAGEGEDEVIYRPPATPIIDFGPHQQKFVTADTAVSDQETKFWDSMNPMPTTVFMRCKEAGAAKAVLFPLVGSVHAFNATDSVEVQPLQQVGMPRVDATTTRIEYVPIATNTAPNPFFQTLRVEFTTPRIIHDPHLLSWPVTYIHAEATHDQTDSSSSSERPDCRLYVDSTGHNVAHLINIPSQEVRIEGHDKSGAHSHHIRMGVTKQEEKVLKSWGDDFMIDWGHQYISTRSGGSNGEYSQVSGGSVDEIREHFARTGEAKPFEEGTATKKEYPFASGAIAAVVGPHIREGEASNSRSEFHVMITYDELYAQYYFGHSLRPRWKCATAATTTTTAQLINKKNKQRGGSIIRDGDEEKCFNSMHDLLQEAWRDRDVIRTAAAKFDRTLDRDVRDRGFGEHYLKLAHNAYRQTIAANNMAYAPEYPNPPKRGGKFWIFQKEISSDGDINTMDVIFPSSPLYLHYAPDLLRDMLVPVIEYALNTTYSKYTKPYSPHQLGTYPVANITMPEQEVMPLENTGNMFLMLYGYLKAKSFNATAAQFFYPDAWPMLTSWADALISDQLPFPPMQTCTDDFSGPTKNSTNLAAKGIISLHAYALLCEKLNPAQTSPNPCNFYRTKARSYAKTFVDVGFVYDGSVGFKHVKLFFDSAADTWSTKYNFLWQKLLEMDGPFTEEEDREIRKAEHKLYLLKAEARTFGFPLDSRFTFQKLDWMTWAFCLEDDVKSFAENTAKYSFKMANETAVRYPLTDLFDVDTAFPDFFFRSRPVVGALFAPFLIYKK